MKGQLLDISVQIDNGIISTTDGSRYKFTGAEWREESLPIRGTHVDFEAEGNSAVNVYRALDSAEPGKKSKAAATLWGAFLGPFGAHKFYMGSWGWGIIYLLFFWLYIPAIVSMVEWIRIVLMSDDEFYAKVEEFQSKGPRPFTFFW